MQDVADEVVQHMRESGQLSRWVTNSIPPNVPPRACREAVLVLDGGLSLSVSDRYATRVVHLRLPYLRIKLDSPLEDVQRMAPARVLPILQAAVADLERIVAAQKE